MIFLYNLFINLYVLGIRFAGLWNKKAAEWISGRKNLFENLSRQISNGDKIIWVHCASAGELEQGKPVIEALKKEYPSHKILLTLFSPSGYAVALKYRNADIISYLPADTRSNAKKFFKIVNPELVIFVKYEYWFHHLSEIAFYHVPLLLVSSIFRKDQVFFKGYGKFFKQILFLFRKIFVQDQSSLELLKTYQIHHAEVAGDTRFDRVKEIADQFSENPVIKSFVGDEKVIVAGSTWPDDERILSAYVKNKRIKIIVAPHEINESHIVQIEKMFPESIRFSRRKEDIMTNGKRETFIGASGDGYKISMENFPVSNARVLIIDNIGMLSQLYYYATITYIGGGFNSSGIHNTLEAAVYGKPVFFGPNYQKFKEARDLINSGGAFSFSNEDDFNLKMDHLLNNNQQLEISSKASGKYVEENTGATEKIIQFIQANLLLTR